MGIAIVFISNLRFPELRNLKNLYLYWLLLFPHLLFSQNGSNLSVHIKPTDQPIVLDGVLDEAAWTNAQKCSGFHQYFPSDSTLAEGQSEIRMTYDQQYLYIAVKCYSADPRTYSISSLRRDYRGLNNDGITILLDTYGDQTNAFAFGLTPYGVRREALISNGGASRQDFSLSWDNKWTAESKIYSGYWIGEMAIPFKTLRYKEGSKIWRFNAYRLDTHHNERSTLNKIPRNFIIFSLAFSAELIWDQPLKKPGPNISLIPYTTASLSKDHENGQSTTGDISVGGDAKIALTPGLNLDLTFNPDFSQVEVDRQVTNLTRFELSFPERRQFFLENADLFASFGESNARPFFSRRIGIARDTVQDLNVQNKIHYGVRLSGKIDRNWRLGLLNMQTAREQTLGLPSANHTVAAIQRRMFQRSNLSLFLVNKQNTGDAVEDDDRYNRVMGVEYNLASADNRWTGKAYYHRSMDPEFSDEQYAHGLSLQRSTRRLEVNWAHQVVGEGYKVEDGFAPRTGFKKINPAVEYAFYPSNQLINEHGPELSYEHIWDDDRKTDEALSLEYRFNFQNNSRLRMAWVREYTYLFSDFDPSGKDGEPLPEGSDYDYQYYAFEFQSDQRKLFNFEIRSEGGAFFNGRRFNIGGEVNYRWQPKGVFSLDFDYNHLEMPDPYLDADIWLVGPRLDLTFSRSIFISALAQYNSQIENININARFQWRYNPVSDLFVVYTDNYWSDSFRIKNRALVLKFTYWLNI